MNVHCEGTHSSPRIACDRCVIPRSALTQPRIIDVIANSFDRGKSVLRKNEKKREKRGKKRREETKATRPATNILHFSALTPRLFNSDRLI